MNRLLAFAAVAASLQLPPQAALAAARGEPPSSPSAATTVSTGTIGGTVSDARGNALGGATIDANAGAAHASAISAADGTFTLTVPPGVYDVTVTKNGFAQAEETNVAVIAGQTTRFRARLTETTISNLRVIGSVSTRGAASSAITPVATIGGTTIAERQATSLQEILPEAPGVTFGARGNTTDPYQYFTVRGASIETRVQLDGHPVNTGYGGRWDLSQIDPDVFGSVDVFKGPGIDGSNAGESVFGTINLRTRDFTRTNVADVRFGIDQWGAQASSFAASGNALRDRLSYVLNYNVAGVVGPEHNQTGYDVETDPNRPGYGLVVFKDTLSDDVNEHSELAKVRYRFSDATSITGAFVGFQGRQNPQGVSYGSSVGPITVEPSLNVNGTIEYNAPYAQNLIGSTVPGSIWYPATITSTNQPFFEAELRTNLAGTSLFLRPYTGVITRFVDGNGEATYPDAIYGTGWTKDASGNYVEAFQSAYDEIEVNRLHGVTFTALRPLSGNDVLNFSYDYHSAYTSDQVGYPDLSIYVAPTTARTHDLSLTALLDVAPKLKLALGDFQTIWNLDYLQGADAASLVSKRRTTSHNDPHIGLNWRPSSTFAVRASAGSGITVPYASQVSGLPTVSNGNSGVNTLVNVNPDLNPEVTVAYGLGLDYVLPGRTKLSLDAYDNTVHSAFVYSTYAVPLTQTATIPYSQVSQYVNGPIERNYGLELSLASNRDRGIGFGVDATLQRAYYDQLAPSFYSLAASTAINGAQINGIPYASVHGELNWTSPQRDLHGAFGGDYVGANNWSNGPGFVTFYATLRRDYGSLGTLQLSAINLFNHGTGAPNGFAIYNGGFATPQLGPSATGTGLGYSNIPQFLQSIPPLTVRVSLSKRISY